MKGGHSGKGNSNKRGAEVCAGRFLHATAQAGENRGLIKKKGKNQAGTANIRSVQNEAEKFPGGEHQIEIRKTSPYAYLGEGDGMEKHHKTLLPIT